MTKVAARAGRWVLVPEELPIEALDHLAFFDMSSVGNGERDAAMECWSKLLSISSRSPPKLQFSKPIFHTGSNLTVRRGVKWVNEPFAEIELDRTTIIVELSSLTYHFNLLQDRMLADEHDPSCRTVDGLLEEMSRVYQGFRTDEQVTLVRFSLPDIRPKNSNATPDSGATPT